MDVTINFTLPPVEESQLKVENTQQLLEVITSQVVNNQSTTIIFIICSQIFANSKGYTLFTGLLMTVLVLPILILTPLVLPSCPFISSTTRPSMH